jgi:hypothetical protein
LFTIKLLNKSNLTEIENFERAFFDAFENIADSSQKAIWDINYVEKTIKFRIPYNDIEIMTLKVDDTIVAASAINFNMKAGLQLEHFGFIINKNEIDICEALVLFNNYKDPKNLLQLHAAFKKELFGYLVSQRIKKIFATCGQKRIRGYRFLGFKDIDMKQFNGQKKYLLCIEV